MTTKDEDVTFQLKIDSLPVGGITVFIDGEEFAKYNVEIIYQINHQCLELQFTRPGTPRILWDVDDLIVMLKKGTKTVCIANVKGIGRFCVERDSLQKFVDLAPLGKTVLIVLNNKMDQLDPRRPY